LFLVKLFLVRFLLLHATFAWRAILIQTAANKFGNPQLPQVLSFGV
jgi:hypothetical protein